MKNNLTCEVVEDLMPSYIDGLTGEVTNKAVREHLAQCDKCKAKLENMKEPYSEDKIEREKKEIDFLKKNRKKNIRTKLLSLLAVVLVVAVAVCTLPYMGSERLFGNELLYDLDVEGDTFKLTMIPTDKDIVIKDVIREEFGNGEVGLNVQGRKISPIEVGKAYTWELTDANIKTLKIFDRIIWEDGEHISDITSAVFDTKHPYMGDISANSVTAEALGIYEYIGKHTNALQSSYEPYEWKIVVTNEFLPQQVKEKEELMIKYAYVLLGVISNLGEVEFEYEVFNAKGDDKEYSLKVTRDEACEFFGDDIGKCFEDINELQKLMEMTGLVDLPYAQQEDQYGFNSDGWERLYFRILNNSESDIQSIHMTWLDHENEIGMGFGIERDFPYFDKSKLNPKEYDFELDELSSNIYDESRLSTTEFQISVYDFDGNEYILDKPVEVSAQFGAVYYLVLEGTFEEGFTVKIK